MKVLKHFMKISELNIVSYTGYMCASFHKHRTTVAFYRLLCTLSSHPNGHNLIIKLAFAFVKFH